MARKKKQHPRDRRHLPELIRELFDTTPQELAREAERFRRTANPPARMSPDLHNALWLGNRLN